VLRIGLVEEARYLSHLEAMNAWLRALRRAKAPLSYSQGFHAHAKVAFSCAHPVGEETTADYMDVSLKQRVDPAALLARLQAALPAGMRAYSCEEVPLHAGSLMSTVSEVDYSLLAMGDPEAIAARIAALHAAPEIVVDRKSKHKRGTRTVDLKPLLRELSFEQQDDRIAIRLGVRVEDGITAKPKEILALLGLENATVRKERTAFL
jgi:radical SAM-linked protein